MPNLVEIDRSKLVSQGGSLYLLAPKILRREGVVPGDGVIFYRAGGSKQIVMRVIKSADKG